MKTAYVCFYRGEFDGYEGKDYAYKTDLDLEEGDFAVVKVEKSYKVVKVMEMSEELDERPPSISYQKLMYRPMRSGLLTRPDVRFSWRGWRNLRNSGNMSSWLRPMRACGKCLTSISQLVDRRIAGLCRSDAIRGLRNGNAQVENKREDGCP